MKVAILGALLAAGMPLFQMSDGELDAYLAGLQGRESAFAERLADVAERTLGTPYANGPLGEGPGAPYDPDPLADFTRVDCVTFVEQSLALACSESREEAVGRLQRIRYRDGRIDFEARNHFMITDWFPNNAFCRDATGDLGVPTESLTRAISRKDFFQRVKAPALGQDTPDRTVTLKYVPRTEAAAAEAQLPSPAVVGFVGKTDWLFVVHCGLYLRDAEGRGRLYQASVPDKKVVSVDFEGYVAQNDRFLGFVAYEIGDPTAATAAH